MTKQKNVKRFVIETLGCKCPDEVFNKIKIISDVAIAENVNLINKIVIGDRLLIYISEMNSKEMIDGDLSKLVRIGLEEREAMGLNRVRIVIMTRHFEEINKYAQKVFNNITKKDDKVHVHIIDKNYISNNDLFGHNSYQIPR